MEDQNLLAGLRELSDDELLREMRFLAERARHNDLRLLAALVEFEHRRLEAKAKVRNLYDFCRYNLGFDENESYRRSKAAILLNGYPQAWTLLEKRRITLSALVVLSSVVKPENAEKWFAKAQGKTRRELEFLVAAAHPSPTVPDYVRTLPNRVMIVAAQLPPSVQAEASPASSSVAPSEAQRRTVIDQALPEAPPDGGGLAAPRSEDGSGEPPQVVVPWGPIEAASAERLDGGWQVLAAVSIDRVRIGFDAAAKVGSLIERARQVLRHKYPEGRLEDIVREALELLLEKRDPQRRLELKAARQAALVPQEVDRLPVRFAQTWATGRYIPARVKSRVWQRDDGRCSWREPDGSICGSRDWLEFDHLVPFSKGGRSDDARNIRLLCREHNRVSAEQRFAKLTGPDVSPDAAPPA